MDGFSVGLLVMPLGFVVVDVLSGFLVVELLPEELFSFPFFVVVGTFVVTTLPFSSLTTFPFSSTTGTSSKISVTASPFSSVTASPCSFVTVSATVLFVDDVSLFFYHCLKQQQ